MKVYEFSSYHVIGNTDSNEGRGSNYIITRCSNIEAANFIANGRGVMGTKATVSGPHKERIVIFDEVKEFWEEENLLARENALAKLTEEEKKLLGL